jgi:uncharacterized membrane protein YeaQ/YmgE (transglycosylase-associated protein family)
LLKGLFMHLLLEIAGCFVATHIVEHIGNQTLRKGFVDLCVVFHDYRLLAVVGFEPVNL